MAKLNLNKPRRQLHRIRVDEVSLVDRGAGEGCVVKLMKRDSDGTPIAFNSREQALQAIADRETQQAMAKAQPVGRAPTEREQYLQRLYTPTIAKAAEPAPAFPPVNPAYQRLEAMAKRAAETEAPVRGRDRCRQSGASPANRRAPLPLPGPTD